MSERKTNAIWYHLYVEYKKYSELMNIAKKTDSQIQKKGSGYLWDGGGKE